MDVKSGMLKGIGNSNKMTITILGHTNQVIALDLHTIVRYKHAGSALKFILSGLSKNGYSTGF